MFMKIGWIGFNFKMINYTAECPTIASVSPG
jgi:hypothetical protein